MWRRISGPIGLIAAGLTAAGLLVAPALSQQSSPLRPGVGSEVVQAACSRCHSIDLAVAHTHTPDEWNEVIGHMIDMGLTASDDQLDQIATYLSTQYAKASTSPATGAVPVVEAPKER